MNNLFIDSRDHSYYDYSYSLIQLNILHTFEKLNLGIVLSDNKGRVEFKTIPSLFELANCLKLEKISGTSFALHIATERLMRNREIIPGNISDELTITTPNLYSSSLDFDLTLNQIFKENITIMKGLEKNSRIENIYDKPHILKDLKDVVSKKQLKNIEFTKKISSVHKKVDIIGTGLNEHNKKTTIVGAEIVSPYVTDFMKSFSESFIVIKELEAESSIKLKLLYMPLLHQQLSNNQRKHYKSAKNIAENSGIIVNDSKDFNEFLGIIENTTKQYNQKLF